MDSNGFPFLPQSFQNVSQIIYQVCAPLCHSEHPDPQLRIRPPECMPWTQSCLRHLDLDYLGGPTDSPSYENSQKLFTLRWYMSEHVARDICIYIVGEDEYDELALTETMFVITSAIKDACRKSPIERLFLDKYGKI
ncbi:hypothetical protein CRYUN_Cryun26dG0013200 [Craigia yunnanensis]